MPVITSEMVEVFDSGARMTWDRLYFGEGLRIRQGEVTLTDTLLLHLKAGLQCWPGAFEIVKTSAAEEARTGADLELWVGSHRLGWLAFLIQAKRIDYARQTYPTLNHQIAGSRRSQFDVLREHARRHGLFPLYWLYNAWPDRARGCPRGWIGDVRSWGCSVAPLSVIAAARATRGNRSFDRIHANPKVVPLRCMFGSLTGWPAREARADDDWLTKIKAAFRFELVVHPEARQGLLYESETTHDDQRNRQSDNDADRRFTRYAALLDLSKIDARDE